MVSIKNLTVALSICGMLFAAIIFSSCSSLLPKGEVQYDANGNPINRRGLTDYERIKKKLTEAYIKALDEATIKGRSEKPVLFTIDEVNLLVKANNSSSFPQLLTIWNEDQTEWYFRGIVPAKSWVDIPLLPDEEILYLPVWQATRKLEKISTEPMKNSFILKPEPAKASSTGDKIDCHWVIVTDLN